MYGQPNHSFTDQEIENGIVAVVGPHPTKRPRMTLLRRLGDYVLKHRQRNGFGANAIHAAIEQQDISLFRRCSKDVYAAALHKIFELRRVSQSTPRPGASSRKLPFRRPPRNHHYAGA